MKRLLAVLVLTLSPAAAHAAPDVLSVGSVTAPNGTLSIPVYVRDVSGTRLGVDRPAGQRIQAVGFKVRFSPASAVTSASFSRGGVLARTPLFDAVLQPTGGVGYVGSFSEDTNALAFTSNGTAPGNLIGHLTVTTSGNLAPGSVITLSLDHQTSILSNQAGTVTETYANGGLSLQNGSITIASGTCPAFTSASTSIIGTAGSCTAGTGGTASVTVGGGGGGHTLQWGWRATRGGAINPIAGANSSSYTISGADFGGAGTRYLVVTATTACAQIVSNELAVTITTTPNVTIDASSGVYAGSNSNYASVASQGAGATYSWTVTNGAIVSGQGTNNIRYSAGTSGQVGLDVVVTANGCAGSSSPHADVPIIARPAGASLLHLIYPCRVLDTRGGSALGGGLTREVLIGGLCGIPADAKAVAANITVLAPTSSGYLAIHPSDAAWAGTSTINYRTAKTRANNAILKLSGTGRVTVINGGTSVHFLIDVTGYFK